MAVLEALLLVWFTIARFVCDSWNGITYPMPRRRAQPDSPEYFYESVP